jgi:hypothetical protein
LGMLGIARQATGTALGGSKMSLRDFSAWLANAFERLREKSPASPPLIGFEGLDVEPDEQEQRWLDEERRVLPYLYWPNI